jgi:hypothetical protein
MDSYNREMDTIKKEMPALSWKTLRDMLFNSFGWATMPIDIVISGQMDADDKIKLPPIPTNPPLVPGSPEDVAWCKIVVTIELTLKEIEVCKKVVTYFVEKGQLSGSRYSAALVKAFID